MVVVRDVVTISAAFLVRAEFDAPIDASSVAEGIRVMNLSTATELAGSVAAAGNNVTFNASESLRAGSQYAITIAPTIRGTNGAPFGQTVVKSFHTPARPTGLASIRPELIRITIPDANGKSSVRGAAGALPAGAQAVAVRRDRDFVVRYQATVAENGSFSFEAGHEDPSDRISTADLIDLQVIDEVSRGIIAVLELTPFSGDDARSFIAPVGRTVRFLSADNIGVTVPAGAFDVPTLIHVTPSAETAFADVPKFGTELRYGASVELTFDGIARKRLDLDLPVPAGVTTAGRDWLVGYLGQSTRGPRVMIVDLAYAADGRFASGLAPTGGGSARIVTNAALLGPELRDYLLGVERSGVFALVDISTAGGPLGFGILSGLQAGFDLFWNTLESLYAAHFYLAEGRGRIAIPIVMGRQFQIVGVDAATGAEAFSRVYDPIPEGDPGVTVTLPSPHPDAQGPYPIFGSPFRIESLDVNVKDVAITALRDFTVTLSGDSIRVETTLAADLSVALLNVSNGRLDASRGGGLSVEGKIGDRIVVMVEERHVDPNTSMSLVFNEPIDAEDSELAELFKITLDDMPVTLNARLDSGGRRVLFDAPASLQRGGKYRLEINPEVADSSGLKIGQVLEDSGPVGGLTEPLYIEFRIREPGGNVASFDLSEGVIRDQALNGNILLISALEGGILAYDTADPAGMTGATPVGRHRGDITDYWALASDHHGRVYATGMTDAFGLVRSFHLDDFPGNDDVQHRSSGIVSFVPGYSASLNLASRTILSDRPEAIPRKLQILLQDRDVPYDDRERFKTAGATVTGTLDAQLEVMRFESPFNPSSPYLVQRVTVENLTLDMRWSADATLDEPATIEGIVGRKDDRFRVIFNERTYGVVSLLGYGIAVLDLNAIESNDAPVKPPDYEAIAELVRITSGKMHQQCGTLSPGASPGAIPDLTFIPDAALLTRAGSSTIEVFGLDPHRGVLDLSIRPPATEEEARRSPARVVCGERAPEGLLFRSFVDNPDPTPDFNYDHPRLAKLRELFALRTGRAPFGRFSGVAPHRWTLEAKDNHVVIPKTDTTPALGERGSEPGTRVTRDYILIPANEYGLLVVEVGGDPPPVMWPSYQPLEPPHLADIIWIPHGAAAVRAIPRTKLAVVVDGLGHVLLVDLSRMDERWGIEEDELFPTVAKILEDDVLTPDPRIVWRSQNPLASGTLAPVVDLDTGYVFAGKVLEKITNVISALDPKIEIIDESASIELKGVVPFGRPRPPAFSDAQLGAFRVVMHLPGGITDSVPDLSLTIESESAPGVAAVPMPSGFVPTRIANLKLRRVVPDSLAPALRYQKGFNKFISDPVIVIADPRASKDYPWPAGADKEAVQCFSCEVPDNLRSNPNAKELWSAGGTIRIRPAGNVFSASPYAYLGESRRLERRIASVRGDLVRPSDGATPLDKLAARNLPTAGASSEQVVAVNTGEIVRSATDLAIKGRGIDFVLTRHYSSAIAHVGPFGRNFDSPLFARVIALPNGDVEFYDGTGRRDIFNAGTTPPEGVFLDMRRDGNGNIVVNYPGNTRMYFDAAGRLAKIADRNATKSDGSDGNFMHFVYGPRGELRTVVDPTSRAIRFDYYGSTGAGAFEGCISKVTDFDGRVVSYTYDGAARLVRVEGPDPESINSAMPSTTYTWGPVATAGTKQQLYASGQMSSEKDGLSRTIWSVTFAAATPWAAQTIASGGGTWTFTLANDKTSVIDPNGHTREYSRDAQGRIASLKEPGSATTTYTFDAGRLASIVRPLGDETRYSYAAGGDRRSMLNVEKITEVPRAGSPERIASVTRETTLAYGAASLLTSMTTPDGAVMSIDRDPRGNPKKITDASGVSTTTTYDERGLLRSVNDPRRGATTYHYETSGGKAGYLRSVATSAGETKYDTNNRGHATKVTDPIGRATEYEINALDQVERLTRGASERRLSYNAARQVVSDAELTDSGASPLLNTTTYGVDELNRVKAIARNGVTTSYGYDAAGNLKTQASVTEAATEYGYDSRDRLTTITQAGRTTTWSYDEDGVPTTVTDPRGKTTSLMVSAFGVTHGSTNPYAVSRVEVQDAMGRALETLVVKTPASGAPLLSQWTTREFDSIGRMRREVRKLFAEPLPIPASGEITGATDLVTTIVYDDANRRVITTDARGGQSIIQYDELGREAKVVDAAGNTIETTYLPNGEKESETLTAVGVGASPVVTKTNYIYDDQNRVAALIDVSDPANPLVRSLRRDPRSNVIEETDPAGNVTKSVFDARGNKTRQEEPNGAVTRWEFDEASNRLVAVVDPRGNRTEYTYDEFGNVRTEKRQDGATWQFTYDANDNLLTTTDPNGTVTTHVYDDENRLTGYHVVRGSGVVGPASVTYTLDDLGRAVATETSEGVKTAHVYDSLDRETRSELRIGSGPPLVTTKTYDAIDEIERLTYPSGLALAHTRDPIGQITEVTEAGSTTPIVRYSYVGADLLTKTLENGATQTRSYDYNARVATLVDQTAAGVLRQLEYARSPLGSKERIARPAIGSFDAFAYNANTWIIQERLRAPLDPAVVVPLPEVLISYAPDHALNYDSIDRQQATTGGTLTASVSTATNARNQYTRFGEKALTYDANGNLRSRAGTALQYDFQNRLVKATVGTTTILETLYDANGTKVRESVSSGGTTTVRDSVVDQGRLLEEYVDGSLAARYLRAVDVDEIARAEVSTTGSGQLDRVLYPIQDELQNVEAITDAGGNLLERYAYEGYGRFRVFAPDGSEHAQSAYGWRWLFHGREYVALLGAYDFRARVLWPDLGRFGQEDPIGTPGTNLYAAFGGDWLSKRDPEGLELNLDETIPSLSSQGLRYNMVNGTAAHKAWKEWLPLYRSSAMPNPERFFSDRWISTIAEPMGITPRCCKRARPDAARLETNGTATLWELKPETYDAKYFTNTAGRRAAAAAQLLRYKNALRLRATYGFGSELNEERYERNYIGVIPRSKGGSYLMYAYSDSDDRGMIYYMLEEQGNEQERRENATAGEKFFKKLEDLNQQMEGVQTPILPVGGTLPVPVMVPIP